MIRRKKIALIVFLTVSLLSCFGGCPSNPTTLSTADQMISFNFITPAAPGIIDNSNHIVAVNVPFGTDVTKLAPKITVSDGATVYPASGKTEDFTNPLAYTVVAQDKLTVQQYTVTVTANQSPPPTGTKKQLTVTGGTGSGQYDSGTVVPIIAQIPADKKFNQWSGDVSNVADVYSASTSITVISDSSISATFFDWPEVSCKIYGYCFGPFVNPGQDPNLGGTVSRDQIRQLLTIAGPRTEWIRTFGSSAGVEWTAPEAKKFGLKVAVGAWISTDAVANQSEIDAAVKIADDGNADIIIIGGEVLLRGDQTPAQLANYLNSVKSRVHIPVTTADVPAPLLAAPEVIAACDLLMVDIYPYWEGTDVTKAMQSFNQTYQQVVSAAGGKQVIVAETGWPSGGDTIGKAVPSPENAAYYFIDFVSWAKANNVSYFYFEAFDEPWKSNEGPQGKTWGNFTSDGILKAGMQPVFDCQTVPDNWSVVVSACNSTSPILAFTLVPAIGDVSNFLEGQVCGVDVSKYAVAVYIYVGGWWTKPTFVSPLTNIAADGSWTCNIVTGGVDQQATQIAAFLVPIDYSPPPLSGDSAIPQSIYTDSLANLVVNR